MPLDLEPDDPDHLAYNLPTRPSQLTGLSDDDLFRVTYKVAYSNEWPFHVRAQFEATRRLIAALTDFKRASARASNVLIALTAVLVVLTAVLIWLTTRL